MFLKILLVLAVALVVTVVWRVKQQPPLLPVGTEAPDFALPDQSGELQYLRSLRGSWVVLYFYPKDDTPGCTSEACLFRAQSKPLADLNIKVLGVSYDDVASHAAFAAKYKLGFTLLSDEKGAVVKAYHAQGVLPKMAQRVSYLIDPKGVIRKTYSKVEPDQHATEIHADVLALSQ